MNEPTIAAKEPAVLDLEPGTHYWCSCGLSKKQPYCNGAHKGTGFTPLAFTIAEKKQAVLCQCKRTGNAPYCDGTHESL